MTSPNIIPLPDSFQTLVKEAELSWRFSQILSHKISDRIARLFLIYKLISRSGCEDFIITGRYGEYFALFQGIIPFFRKRLLLLDIEWYGDRSNQLINKIKIVMHKLMAKGADNIGVFCEAEKSNYAKWYGIEEEKFIWIPYCSDLDETRFDTSEDGYIFTGGIFNRDYETLFEAVKDIPIEIKVAAPKNKIDSRFISSNMTLLGTITEDEYFSVMAKSVCVVLSLQPNLRRYPGVISYVSAMKLGKAVILNENEGSKSYIESGKTGVLVQPKDPIALRNAIEGILKDAKLRKSISLQARKKAAESFSAKRYSYELSNWVESYR